MVDRNELNTWAVQNLKGDLILLRSTDHLSWDKIEGKKSSLDRLERFWRLDQLGRAERARKLLGRK